MSKIKREINYHCRDDCRIEGCPSHLMSLEFNSVTNYYKFSWGKREFYSEEWELKAMIELIKKLDRKDCIQIK